MPQSTRSGVATKPRAIAPMRPLPTFVAAALVMGLAACEASSERTAPTTRPSVASTGAASSDFSTYHNDRDNDGDHNDDDENVLGFGHAADPADRLASVALVERYFAAAAAANGAQACRLLAPFVAESVPEDDGHSPGLRGRTCPVVMSKLFELHRRLLVEKKTTLKVVGVRVEGDKALAILEFPTIPEVRQIAERRVKGTWRVLELLDNILE
jgi:hypothetical protein